MPQESTVVCRKVGYPKQTTSDRKERKKKEEEEEKKKIDRSIKILA